MDVSSGGHSELLIKVAHLVKLEELRTSIKIHVAPPSYAGSPSDILTVQWSRLLSFLSLFLEPAAVAPR